MGEYIGRSLSGSVGFTDRMPRTAILYARSNRRENLDRQVRELEEWRDRAGVVPISTVHAGLD